MAGWRRVCSSRPSPHGARTFQRSARVAFGGNAVLKKSSFPISFGFGFWRIFGACGGHSVCKVNLTSLLTSPGTGGAENDVRLTLHTRGPPHIPKSRTPGFHGRAMGNPSRIYMGPWTAVADDVEKCFGNQQKREGRNPTVLPLETLSFCSLVL